MAKKLFAGMLGILLATLFIGSALAEEASASAEIETASADAEKASTAIEAASAPEIQIAITNANFVATSPEKENLDEEWVEVTNKGSADVNLIGWTLTDEQNHTYTFPDFVLAAGSKVIVRTGVGDDSPENLFWNRSTSIWNNGGDLAILKDPEGNIIYTYPEEDEEKEGEGKVA